MITRLRIAPPSIGRCPAFCPCYDGAFIVGFEPGTKFYEDYDRFYRRRSRAGRATDTGPESRAIGEPLKFAYLFAEMRTGRKVSSVAYVNSKDVQTAKDILAEIPFDQAPAFLEFALAAARQTNFDIQTLGGVRQYLARYKANRAARQREREASAAQQRDEGRRIAYDRYRRQTAEAVFSTLPSKERQMIERQAEREAARFRGSLRASMTGVYRTQITAKRHSNTIKSFDEWRETA